MKNFPMFLKMQDRRVIVIGGGEQAAQKTRLMLKTEAEIVLYAETLEPELAGLAAQGAIVHRCGAPDAAAFTSAILVFSATDCPKLGAQHAALAKQTNTLINVVDMPEFCEAMTPSIVDRDPVVVAIGTEGTAPVLGRLIKSDIEALLEPELGAFARFAGRMRAQVAQKIDIAERRFFWRWVFSGAARKEFRAGHHLHAFEIVKTAIEQSQLESGAGSTEWLCVESQNTDDITLGGLRKLQEADTIFYARHKHDRVLELARRDAVRVAYDTALPKQQIAALSGQGNTVVLFDAEPSSRLQ